MTVKGPLHLNENLPNLLPVSSCYLDRNTFKVVGQVVYYQKLNSTVIV